MNHLTVRADVASSSTMGVVLPHGADGPLINQQPKKENQQ